MVVGEGSGEGGPRDLEVVKDVQRGNEREGVNGSGEGPEGIITWTSVGAKLGVVTNTVASCTVPVCAAMTVWMLTCSLSEMAWMVAMTAPEVSRRRCGALERARYSCCGQVVVTLTADSSTLASAARIVRISSR